VHVRGASDRVLEQGRLADARLATQDQCAAQTGAHRAQQPIDLLLFGCPPQQGCRRCPASGHLNLGHEAILVHLGFARPTLGEFTGVR
jgi:hypothetical protein